MERRIRAEQGGGGNGGREEKGWGYAPTLYDGFTPCIATHVVAMPLVVSWLFTQLYRDETVGQITEAIPRIPSGKSNQ